jgi:hypothetical protein
MEVFRNVGLFIQVSVGFFDGTNGRKPLDTSNTQRSRPYEKKGSRFPGSSFG